MEKVWLTRGGANGEFEDFALDVGTSGGGWATEGDISSAADYLEVRNLVASFNPDAKLRSVANWASQLWALKGGMEIGDYILMPRKGQGAVAVGVVTSGYVYDAARPPGERHYRRVDWKNADVPKTAFGADIQRSLGTFMTICEVSRDQVFDRVASVLATGQDPYIEDVALSDPVAPVIGGDAVANVENDAQVSIQELIRVRFPTHALADLIAAVLQAKGFQTWVSPPGPDGGVDIRAARGDLGFEEPRISVQVKNTRASMGVSDLNELMGAKTVSGATSALFVSWGGFTQPARQMVRTSWFELRLWDADEIVAQVTSVYDQLDPVIRAQLPLRQVWTPTIDDAI